MFRQTDCNDEEGRKIPNCEAALADSENFWNSMNLEEIPTGSASPVVSPNAWWGKTKPTVPL